MKLEINELYINKTWRFLVPCLKGHGEGFTERFNFLFKLAVGVDDTLFGDRELLEGKRPVFIMIDKKFNELRVDYFMKWIRYQDYYITEYCPDSEISLSRRHMVVISVPTIYNDAYDHFLKGEYSLMYEKKDIELLFVAETRQKDKQILLRSGLVLKDHLDDIKKEFGAVPNGSVEIREYELPLKRVEEIFFYEEEKIFF